MRNKKRKKETKFNDDELEKFVSFSIISNDAVVSFRRRWNKIARIKRQNLATTENRKFMQIAPALMAEIKGWNGKSTRKICINLALNFCAMFNF